PPALFGTNMTAATMSGDATHFLYYTSVNNGQLATMDIDPTSLGASPAVTEAVINPSFLLSQNSPAATVTARVEAPGTINRVNHTPLNGGVAYGQEISSHVMFDDGHTDGDSGATDHVYTSNRLVPLNSSIPVGPRTIRVQAVNQTSDGLYHGIAV